MCFLGRHMRGPGVPPRRESLHRIHLIPQRASQQKLPRVPRLQGCVFLFAFRPERRHKGLPFRASRLSVLAAERRAEMELPAGGVRGRGVRRRVRAALLRGGAVPRRRPSLHLLRSGVPARLPTRHRVRRRRATHQEPSHLRGALGAGRLGAAAVVSDCPLPAHSASSRFSEH